MGETRKYEVAVLPNINRLARDSYVDIVGVTGSIPVTPTIHPQNKALVSLLFLEKAANKLHNTHSSRQVQQTYEA